MRDKSEEKLFNEFPPVSTQQWENVIKTDLKGSDYEKKLIWNTGEGFKVKPYYRLEDIEKLSYLNLNPGEFPYVRSNKTRDNNWEIRQDIKVTDIEQANLEALKAIENAVTSIGFIVTDKIKTAVDFFRLVKGVSIGCINFNLIGDNIQELLKFVIDESERAAYDKNMMDGCIEFSPLCILSKSGNWISDEKSDFVTARSIIETAKISLPKYRILAVDGSMFQESGASIVQTLGCSLAIAAEYLDRLTDLGLYVDDIAPRIQFNFTSGSNYFMEIAKIRAFRLLWARLVETYNPLSNELTKAFIHCTTSKWNMTIYDPYVNMLRVTTESMSVVIGGADSLSVRAFDAPFKKANNFSYRIARNIQIILKEEAYFDRTIDPVAGSYYTENLTDSIAAEAWEIFLNIDKEGGYSKSFIKGTIQADIEKVASKRLSDIAVQREMLLGVNRFPNFKEKILNNIDSEVLEETNITASNLIARPLKEFRGAQDFEILRLKTEKRKKCPKVFMLTIGDITMRLARSQFAGNFFACAGFEITDNNGFKTVEDGAKAALKSKADIVVLCSSNEEYEIFAPKVFELLDGNAILVVAGDPPCRSKLEAIGITNFISIRSNVLEELKNYQDKLKID